jgi:hypothetical protein
MVDSPIVRGRVVEVLPQFFTARVRIQESPPIDTWVYPQDGALPDAGSTISLTRNGGDLVPLASSQRAYGTFRGAIEAESFVGTSNTRMDVWETSYTWGPSSGTTVALGPRDWCRHKPRSGSVNVAT